LQSLKTEMETSILHQKVDQATATPSIDILGAFALSGPVLTYLSIYGVLCLRLVSSCLNVSIDLRRLIPSSCLVLS
jgi:hypothetical protein